MDPSHPYHNVSGGKYTIFDSLLDGIINKVEKVNDYTVRFTLKLPNIVFLSNIAAGFSSILSAEYADKMMAAGNPEKFDNDPIGTGPFQLVKYEKDSRIIYKANPEFWGSKPKIDRLVFSITTDPSIRQAKLEKNECQIMSYPNPSDIDRIRKNKNIVLMQYPALNIGYILFNVEKKPLDNVKVRQALSMAIDKDSIIDAVYQGTGQKAKTLIPPTVLGYNSSLKDYNYDPKKAKSLLKEAGFPDGFDIDIWVMPVNRPYNPNPRRMGEMIQFDWAQNWC
ncbi:dipeptide ABC transporter periplasmic substrate-binding protein DppA [Candidatus Liberibacter americanus PW_SP]|nr:dipeptide ABC transporter periplasmic substrate-binding protein DppA [Candidatus Liberibacter americanus PW_SP]